MFSHSIRGIVADLGGGEGEGEQEPANEDEQIVLREMARKMLGVPQ